MVTTPPPCVPDAERLEAEAPDTRPLNPRRSKGAVAL